MLFIIGTCIVVFSALTYLAILTAYEYMKMVEDDILHVVGLVFMIGLDVIAIHFCILGYMRFIYPYFLGR